MSKTLKYCVNRRAEASRPAAHSRLPEARLSSKRLQEVAHYRNPLEESAARDRNIRRNAPFPLSVLRGVLNHHRQLKLVLGSAARSDPMMQSVRNDAKHSK